MTDNYKDADRTELFFGAESYHGEQFPAPAEDEIYAESYDTYTYDFDQYCLHKIVGHIDDEGRLRTIGYGYMDIPVPLPWWARLIYFCVIFSSFLLFCGAGYFSTVMEEEKEDVEVIDMGAATSIYSKSVHGHLHSPSKVSFTPSKKKS